MNEQSRIGMCMEFASRVADSHVFTRMGSHVAKPIDLNDPQFKKYWRPYTPAEVAAKSADMRKALRLQSQETGKRSRAKPRPNTEVSEAEIKQLRAIYAQLGDSITHLEYARRIGRTPAIVRRILGPSKYVWRNSKLGEYQAQWDKIAALVAAGRNMKEAAGLAGVNPMRLRYLRALKRDGKIT